MTLRELYDYCVKQNISLDSELVFGWEGYYSVNGFGYEASDSKYGYFSNKLPGKKRDIIFQDLEEFDEQEKAKFNNEFKPTSLIILNNKYAEYFP